MNFDDNTPRRAHRRPRVDGFPGMNLVRLRQNAAGATGNISIPASLMKRGLEDGMIFECVLTEEGILYRYVPSMDVIKADDPAPAPFLRQDDNG